MFFLVSCVYCVVFTVLILSPALHYGHIKRKVFAKCLEMDEQDLGSLYYHVVSHMWLVTFFNNCITMDILQCPLY